MTADGPVVERLVMIDDMSQISQGLGQELAPVVAQMAHDLNMFDLDQISDPEIFLDIARQVHRLELLCLSLGVDPNS
jgi:hypothetical protein